MAKQRSYDAIIVGASLAGLAVARRTPDDVLLVDRHEVGSVQTSSCGTPLWMAQALGEEGSVRQVHDRLVLRTPARSPTTFVTSPSARSTTRRSPGAAGPDAGTIPSCGGSGRHR